MPNLAELASNGRHEGTFRYEIGNNQLKPEFSNQLDWAFFMESKHISFSFSPFLNWVKNYVFAEKLLAINGGDSLIVGDEEDVHVYQYRQNAALLYGGEVYLDFHPHPLDWLHIENSFSLVYAQQVHQSDSLKYLPFIPAPKYRTVIRADFNKVSKSVSRLYVGLGVDYVFAQNRYFSAYHTETYTADYCLLGVYAGIDLLLGKEEKVLHLRVSCDNLLNRAYQNHLNRLKYAPVNSFSGNQGIFNSGRNISVSLLFDIND
jgi:iron complex outermembrane receptor protein